MAKYDRAVVTFIDILGFSDLVEESRSDKNNCPDRVDRILRVLNKLKRSSDVAGRIRYDYEGKETALLTTDNFSDCLVRSTPIEHPSDEIEALESELPLLAAIQTAVTTKEGVMIRGGMATGELFRDEKGDFLFGPAFVDAYKLEKEAVVPRIVVARGIVNSLAECESHLLGDYVKQDADGLSFVDYLHGTYRGFEPWLVPDISDRNQMMSEHKEAVERNNERLRAKSMHVRLKGHWMANYHNQTIERLLVDSPSFEERVDQYRINTTDICH